MEAFETLLIRHCSPTLAGIKTGSLFNYRRKQNGGSELLVRGWNRALNPRGVALIVLRRDPGRDLVYVFRPKKLRDDLACADTAAFLSSFGYDCGDTASCLRMLAERVNRHGSFPHEIGLFLGYPLRDVQGFIENAGRNCKCCGMWKVYCDECQAVLLFEKFRKCTSIYCRCLENGLSVQRLTVAAGCNE